MSTALSKRTHAEAFADAEAFRNLFPREAWKQWHFAGSLRRCKPDVSDVEHVIVPAWEEMEVADGLFPKRTDVNLILLRLDELVEAGQLIKHLYPNGTHRWGERYRGVEFRQFTHEIFMADADNLGFQLTIRTGPAEFSKHLVSSANRRGLRQDAGYVWEGERKITVPTEQDYFRCIGLQYVPPERRGI